NVDFVHKRAGNLEADDVARIIHRSADGRAVVPLAPVEVDFLVRLVDLDAEAEALRRLFHRGPERVPDVSIGRGEVALHRLGMLASEEKLIDAAYIRLAGAEAADIGPKLGVQFPQEYRLGRAQAW